MAKPVKFNINVEKAKFDAFIREYTKNMTGPTQDAMIRNIAFELLDIIIHNTPVDTGRARSGWTAWADRNGLEYDMSGPKVTQEGISQGKSEGSFEDRTNAKGTRIIFINAVPYIAFLEFGSSDQFPHGMVRFAMRTLLGRGDARRMEEEALKKALAAANKKARTARSKK